MNQNSAEFQIPDIRNRGINVESKWAQILRPFGRAQDQMAMATTTKISSRWRVALSLNLRQGIKGPTRVRGEQNEKTSPLDEMRSFSKTIIR
jgi:hypothetical protein